MSASVWEKDSEEYSWWLSEEQGSDLEKYIHEKLSQDKRLVSIVQSEKYQRSEKKAAICCPHQEWHGQKASGSHIIAALKAFFGLDATRVQAAHGFVRDHVHPETTFCQYRCGEQSNIEFSNDMWPVVAEKPNQEINDGGGSKEPETPSSSTPENDRNARADEGEDSHQVLPDDTDDDAASVKTEALDNGRPIELWPQFYGWEGVKRVDARPNTKYGHSMDGEWASVWCDDGGGWRSSRAKLPIELDCLK